MLRRDEPEDKISEVDMGRCCDSSKPFRNIFAGGLLQAPVCFQRQFPDEFVVFYEDLGALLAHLSASRDERWPRHIVQVFWDIGHQRQMVNLVQKLAR